MLYISPTVTGLESLAGEELRALGAKVREKYPGLIIYSGKEELIYKINYMAKSISKVILIYSFVRFESLLDIQHEIDNAAQKVTYGKYEVRVAIHSAYELSLKKLKEYIIKSLLNAKKLRSGVHCPKITVFAWVIDDYFIFGIDTTGVGLEKRWYRSFKHPASLNPLISSSMLRMAGWKGEKIVDPFCGSGTVLIEASHLYYKVPNLNRKFKFVEMPFYRDNVWKSMKTKYYGKVSNLYLMGIDKNPRYIEGAERNAYNAGVKLYLKRGLAEELHRYTDSKFIITNPPYGLRMETKKSAYLTYEKFIKELEEYFSGATLVVITPLNKFEYYFEVKEKYEIIYGKLKAQILKLKI